MCVCCCCYHAVTMLLSYCYHAVIMLLSYCYHAFTILCWILFIFLLSHTLHLTSLCSCCLHFDKFTPLFYYFCANVRCVSINTWVQASFCLLTIYASFLWGHVHSIIVGDYFNNILFYFIQDRRCLCSCIVRAAIYWKMLKHAYKF